MWALSCAATRHQSRNRFHWMCSDAASDVSNGALWVGIAFAVGGFVTFVPQHVAIVSRQSARGLSVDAVFVANIGAVSSLVNVGLAKHRSLLQCSAQWHAWCACHWVVVSQMASAVAGYFPTFLLIVWYGRRDSLVSRAERERMVKLLVVFIVIVAVSMSTVVAVVGVLDRDDREAYVLAAFFGVVSALATICQYAPQIYLTYVAGNVGSLSVGTLAIQAPGTLALTLYLAYTSKERWLTWLAYAVAAVQQWCLLALVLHLKRFPRMYQPAAGAECFSLGECEMGSAAGASGSSERIDDD